MLASLHDAPRREYEASQAVRCIRSYLSAQQSRWIPLVRHYSDRVAWGDKSRGQGELWRCCSQQEVEICPVSALAFYLLEMWMDPEDVPFDDPNWPRYYLMPGKSASEQLSPAAQYASTKQLYLAAGDNPLFRKFKDDLSDKMRNAGSLMEDSPIAPMHLRSITSFAQYTPLFNAWTKPSYPTRMLFNNCKSAEGIVLLTSNKAIADGLSVDRVYEFMETMGKNIERAARRERRYLPGQQQQETLPEQSRRPEQQGPESQEQRDQNQPVANQPAANRSQTFEERLAELETQLASRYDQVPPRTLDDVDPTMLPRSVSLERHWEEWFKGVDGRPSLWILNKTFKSKWRQGRGNTLTQTFSFKKAIVSAVLKDILSEEAHGGTVDEREARAFKFLIGHLNSGTTLNQIFLRTHKKKNQPEAREDGARELPHEE
ncbi:hypothetical protein KVV02_007338 [Mortierella alpina]|uniref:Transcription activator GCR1-like domain-containing protein n=1 Tax=Mortierella alpina TaxID=64518 RepID=A0A9P7ZZB4_MORAP|nr:hypothetical protein KVV02_007338 [Mortierella alpina]